MPIPSMPMHLDRLVASMFLLRTKSKRKINLLDDAFQFGKLNIVNTNRCNRVTDCCAYEFT